jgi:hypothetical protein
MCAIFGTNKIKLFDELYELNHHRGGFAFSSTWINKYTSTLSITEGGYKGFTITGADYILAHDQAPTSSIREFSTNTSHPFRCGKWNVAHNGVLTNHTDLIPNHTCEVDSSYIPVLLDKLTGECKDSEYETQIVAIEQVCSKLEGTFACWITYGHNIYLVKQGSTLFANQRTFSSTKFEDSKSLNDGKIYMILENGISEVGQFKNSSPFMLIS